MSNRKNGKHIDIVRPSSRAGSSASDAKDQNKFPQSDLADAARKRNESSEQENPHTTISKHKRGGRSHAAILSRRANRREKRGQHRREFRGMQKLFSCVQKTEAAWTTDLCGPSVINKTAVHNSTSKTKLMVAYWNIETILRAGIIHQFVSYMTNNQIKILFLAETKAGKVYINEIG